jgi:AraC-like DNA-binding protein
MSNLAVIRLAHPLAFKAFLRHVGAPVEGYFRRQELPVLCDDPDAFVPLRKAWGFFNDVAMRETRMAGWHVGQYVGDHNLSGLIQLVSSEASHLQLGILERQNNILFYNHYPGMRFEPGYSVSQAYQLEVYADLVRHYAGPGWQPQEIGIEAAEVPSILEDHFPNSTLGVNQPFGYLTISRSCLPGKLCSHHKETNEDSRLILTDTLDFAGILGVLLEPYLPEGYPRMSFAASLVECSARTLARRLASCSKSCQALVDEVRFKRAKTLLGENDRLIEEVALSVGFYDQANFSRMFRRMAGLSLRQYRRIVHDRTQPTKFAHTQAL